MWHLMCTTKHMLCSVATASLPPSAQAGQMHTLCFSRWRVLVACALHSALTWN